MEGVPACIMGEEMSMTSARKLRLLFVGAFPPEGKKIFGGQVAGCHALMQSSFPERLELDLIDSTQVSHPPPPFLVRLLLAIRRLFIFVGRLERRKPDAVLLFVAVGASVIEKGAMSWYSRLRGVPTLMFPRVEMDWGKMQKLHEIDGVRQTGEAKVLCPHSPQPSPARY